MFTKGLMKTAGIGSALGKATRVAGKIKDKLMTGAAGAVKNVARAVSPAATMIPKPARQAIGREVSAFKKAKNFSPSATSPSQHAVSKLQDRFKNS